MKTPAPPAALALLFPELPRWALAPFLGEPYIPVPFPNGAQRVWASIELPQEARTTTHHRNAGRTPANWRSMVMRTRESDNDYVTAWSFDSAATPIPFGVAFAHLSRPGEEARTESGARVWVREKEMYVPGSVGLSKAGLDDLTRRWRAISDPVAQQEILAFWLGHEITALAQLGLSMLGQGVSPRR